MYNIIPIMLKLRKVTYYALLVFFKFNFASCVCLSCKYLITVLSIQSVHKIFQTSDLYIWLQGEDVMLHWCYPWLDALIN